MWRKEAFFACELSVSGLETIVSQCPLIWTLHIVLVGIRMGKKSRVFLLAIFAIALITIAPASALFAGQNQPLDLTAKKIVEIAEAAEGQVKNLIDTIYADEEALQKITEADLMDNLEHNVALHEEGVEWLNLAEQAYENADYNQAVVDAKEALRTFRQVFKSINLILQDAGLKTDQQLDAVSLVEAINRALNKIAKLREILPSDAIDQIIMLDQAEALLNIEEAQNLILEGKLGDLQDRLIQANQLITQVYQYLKFEAEECNTDRIYGYLQGAAQSRERIRERFGAANTEGVDVTSVLNSLGYQNEEEFMQALQNNIQNAQGEIGNLDSVIQELNAINEAIQQMDQTLTQEMNRHRQQGQNGNGNNEAGSGDTGTSGFENGAGNNAETGTGSNTESGAGFNNSGSGTTGNGSGSDNSGTSGGSGYGSGAGTGGSSSGSGSGRSGQ